MCITQRLLKEVLGTVQIPTSENLDETHIVGRGWSFSLRDGTPFQCQFSKGWLEVWPLVSQGCMPEMLAGTDSIVADPSFTAFVNARVRLLEDGKSRRDALEHRSWKGPAGK